MNKLLAAVILSFIINLNTLAQTPDSLLKPSPVKTFNTQQYNALIKGEDLYNLSLVANLNKYPDPFDALRFKKELDLSPAQIANLGKLTKELSRKKIEMGNFIVTNETKLDNIFKLKKASESDLIFYTNRYGLYMGELRNAILVAFVKTFQLLSPPQINKLQVLKNHN